MNRAALLLGFFCLLIFGLFAIAAESNKAEPLLGDEGDGSMKTPIHIIPLFPETEDGEKGSQIKADTNEPLPFSTRLTCGECHSYDSIKHGWHFNAVDSNVPPGRQGQPWIYFDSKLCTQIPLSYRKWPGTYKPEQLGLSDFKFTGIFGRHMPGGGPGEIKAKGTDGARQFVSGKLEINCLVCHDGHYGLNLGSVTGYSVQVSTNQNFRWAAAASSEFAEVSGSAAQMDDFYDPFRPAGVRNEPKVTYRKEVFSVKNEVLFDLVREVPNDRCYYCHSNLHQESNNKTEKWTQDEDIHLTAGLKCVDCHRNGLDHNIIRGYPEEEGISDNPLVSSSTCQGCHLPDGDGIPIAGRLGAPIPTHPGIPSVHFDKLTCTACHSGPWPREEAVYTKTSRAHRLGTPNVNKEPDALPHILSPVLAKQGGIITDIVSGEIQTIQDEKLAPHKVLWPSFWAVIDNNEVKPIQISIVEKVVKPVFDKLEMTYRYGWPQLTKEMIQNSITALSKNTSVKGKAAYVSAGKLYSLDDSGTLTEQEHAIAQPYLWPLAHNVRPAAQALGVRYCTDCHETKSGFFFGKVKVDSPVADEWQSTRKMIEFEDLKPFYTKAFAFSFIFRPWMKIICICCSLVIAGVLLLYALRALMCIAKIFGKGN
ncbi:MAG: hypothetical protein JW787_04195 [Sedimentisphaerales bacterium]|nr:hypothetical protein [Sedimentisphaerales bacterium]